MKSDHGRGDQYYDLISFMPVDNMVVDLEARHWHGPPKGSLKHDPPAQKVKNDVIDSTQCRHFYASEASVPEQQ